MKEILQAGTTIVEAGRKVGSPIGSFGFGLAALLLFLLACGAFLGLGVDFNRALVVIGIFAFLLHHGLITLLALKYPNNLLFGEETRFRYEQMKYGSSQHPMPAVLAMRLPAEEAVGTGNAQPALDEGER